VSAGLRRSRDFGRCFTCRLRRLRAHLGIALAPHRKLVVSEHRDDRSKRRDGDQLPFHEIPSRSDVLSMPEECCHRHTSRPDGLARLGAALDMVV
jgi:hypothetical protein